jgi:hypothetical protein
MIQGTVARFATAAARSDVNHVIWGEPGACDSSESMNV